MSDQSPTPFAELGLSAPLLKAIADVGYESASPIQAQSIPPLLEGRDLLGQAQTGTGKTAAFALPLLERIDLSSRKPQLLVLTPTRELAIQVAEAMQTYARHLRDFHVLPVYGGQSMSLQLRQLQRGPQVIVGTPGRILDHLGRRSLRLDGLRALVLDEADEMLRMGFIEDVEAILEATPEQRQVALFSATMPPAIARVAASYLKNPVEIRIAAKTATVASVEQRFWPVAGLHKLDALTRIFEVEDFDGVIVFVRTKVATEELADRLEARGYAAAALNGDMGQAQREKVVERLRGGSLDIVVATDVAARGLDVERITHVINYDIPNDPEAYVHRIGRTGRAGRKGQAILFVSNRERRMLRSIEHATRQPITPMRLPSQADIADKRIARFKQMLDETLETAELDFFRGLVDSYREERAQDAEDIAAALVYLMQKERPLSPPANPEPEPRAPREERPRRNQAGFSSDAPQGMVRYRIEVGRDHGVQPKNIVGAIANEAGVDSRNIGHIKLFDNFSTVDLPDGMPPDLFKHLQGVWVCGRQLRISVDNGPVGQGGDQPPRRAGKPPAHGKPHAGKPAGGHGKPKPGPKPGGKPKTGPKSGPKAGAKPKARRHAD